MQELKMENAPMLPGYAKTEAKDIADGALPEGHRSREVSRPLMSLPTCCSAGYYWREVTIL